MENVDIASDGSFNHSVFLDEKIRLSLSYNGTNGTVPHSFKVSHDAGVNATTDRARPYVRMSKLVPLHAYF